MYRTERLGLLLTPTEKTAVVQMADADGGLPQSALVRRLIRNATQERGIWPPNKPRIASKLPQRVGMAEHPFAAAHAEVDAGERK